MGKIAGCFTGKFKLTLICNQPGIILNSELGKAAPA